MLVVVVSYNKYNMVFNALYQKKNTNEMLLNVK